jgi:hypothetical protein
MKNKEKILKKYYKSINDLTDLFISKYFPDFDKSDYYWIVDDIGGVLQCGDYFFDLKTIQKIVELDLSDAELDKWIDYQEDLIELNSYNGTIKNEDIIKINKKFNISFEDQVGVESFIGFTRKNITDGDCKK